MSLKQVQKKIGKINPRTRFIIIIIIGSVIVLAASQLFNLTERQRLAEERKTQIYGVTGTAPVPTISKPTGGVATSPIAWSFTISDADDDIAEYTFTVSLGLVGQKILSQNRGLATGAVVKSGSYYPEWGTGDYTFELRCKDQSYSKSTRITVYFEEPAGYVPPGKKAGAAPGFEFSIVLLAIGVYIWKIKKRNKKNQ